MAKRKIAKTLREQFMQAVNDELAKFERKELAFQRAERAERAAVLRLPLAVTPNRNQERK